MKCPHITTFYHYFHEKVQASPRVVMKILTDALFISKYFLIQFCIEYSGLTKTKE